MFQGGTSPSLEEMVLEEWARIPQDWINELSFKAGTLGSSINGAPRMVNS
jgi:hypothetical protein